ncbi:hypothetical protein D9611_013773 [Ephemerocybe angulata]|uniref:DUF4246 domain-containing protein n=1 Tax=Ephemerocybe angulata TaxID=980116 RepID=A0A8H5FET9_9AGAR|nr:hypothetical protein D9611_013773 [Tulosesus angulatus]
MASFLPLLVYPKPGHGEDVTWVFGSGADAIDMIPSGELMYPNALDLANTGEELRAILELITLREFTMLRFMNAVTDKPDWTTKVFDDAILDK